MVLAFVHSTSLPKVDSPGSHGPEVLVLPNFKTCRTLMMKEQVGKGNCSVRPLKSALTGSQQGGRGQPKESRNLPCGPFVFNLIETILVKALVS